MRRNPTQTALILQVADALAQRYSSTPATLLGITDPAQVWLINDAAATVALRADQDTSAASPATADSARIEQVNGQMALNGAIPRVARPDWLAPESPLPAKDDA